MRADDEIGRLEERIAVLFAQRGDMEAFRHLVTRYERWLVYYFLEGMPLEEIATVVDLRS